MILLGPGGAAPREKEKEGKYNTFISKMVTFIKMVITQDENESPDMIPVAFDRKFDEKKDEIPPGIYRPHIFEIYQYWGVDG